MVLIVNSFFLSFQRLAFVNLVHVKMVVFVRILATIHLIAHALLELEVKIVPKVCAESLLVILELIFSV